MPDTPDAARVRILLDHIDTRLGIAREVYLDALNDALLFVISEATTPTRRDKLAPGAAFQGAPDDTIGHRLDVDGYLMTWEAGAAAAELRRLNRTDLAAAADRLGMTLPELHHGRPQ
jgi:hypothetical protein